MKLLEKIFGKPNPDRLDEELSKLTELRESVQIEFDTESLFNLENSGYEGEADEYDDFRRE